MSFVQVPPDSTGKKIFHTTAIDGIDTVYMQGVNITDPSNPDHSAYVDPYGSIFTRFKDGSPGLDVYKRLVAVDNNLLGVYEFTNDSTDLFASILTDSATAEYNEYLSAIKLLTTSHSSSSVRLATNKCHYFQVGTSGLYLTSVMMSDSGKANNTRNWGYFTENNGYFFQLNGTDLNFIIRSNRNEGTVEETVLPQQSWNNDRADGSGGSNNLSGANIDVTKMNLFWMEWSFPSSILHFGVYANGLKVLCHIVSNPGGSNFPLVRTATLPVKYENINTGMVSGGSELRVYGAVVASQGSIDYTFWRYTGPSCTAKTVTTNTPLFTIRAKQLLPTGRFNNIQSYPENLNVYSDQPVKLTAVWHLTSDNLLTDEVWNIDTGYSTIGDNTASAINLSDTTLLYTPISRFVNGASNISLGDYIEVPDEAITLMGDRVDTYCMTIIATRLTNNTTTVSAELNTKELW